MNIKNFYWRIRNFLYYSLHKNTIGVRALVIKDDKVLLVKHTYLPQWYHIGGGIEKGETPPEAISRELIEEAGIYCNNKPELFSVYYNNKEKRDDYVIFFIVKDFYQRSVVSAEIKDSQWFDIANLPNDISPATKRRIDEYISGEKNIPERW